VATPAKRILVVEDDASLRDLLRVHLGALGYGVHIAADAAEAIRTILPSGGQPQVPDLIIADINLPYLDGFELVRALRGDPVTTNVPVIVLTARVDDDSFVRAMELGVKQYITKPVQLEDLIDSIQSALNREPRTR
jgi:DNA-binding response OmpR family regulator